jgi:uncharacterized SAM-binding protein YcdF (DUF218 family)
VTPTPANCNNCGARTAWLQGLGVPGPRVGVLAPPVTNTYDEAVAARAYCAEHGVTRLVIVTSPYHTRRTLATFRTVFRDSGISLGVEPALEHSTARPDDWWARSGDRWYVSYEWAALAWYAVRYGVNPLSGGPREVTA